MVLPRWRVKHENLVLSNKLIKIELTMFRTEQNMTRLMALNLEMNVPARVRAQLSNMPYEDTLECTTDMEKISRPQSYI